MENLWTPLFSLTVFLIVFAVGDVVSYKTKGLISGIIIAAVVYIAGYWTGIIPTDSVASTGMPTMLTAFMIPLLLVNLGTSISISQLLSEWKTVAIALIGLVGLALISFTVSSMLFTREYALSASSPIAGGTIAAIITHEAAGGPIAVAPSPCWLYPSRCSLVCPFRPSCSRRNPSVCSTTSTCLPLVLPM